MESLPNLELEDLRARNKALEKKVQFFESLLSQKLEATRRSYAEMKPYFDSQKKQIMELFFENFPQRLSHQDIIDQFSARYPAVSTANLGRRVRELCEDKRLCSYYDQGRELTVFFLKLLPEGDDRKNQHGDTASLKSPEDK